MLRLLLCLVTASPWLSATAVELHGPAVVLAGDTLEIAGERVRLRGVDAPGIAQRCLRDAGVEWRCGLLARVWLGRRIGGRSLACEGGERDGYGQRLVACRVDGITLDSWLVEQGWAIAAGPEHAQAQATARTAGRGLWRGGFEPSAEWRLAASFPYRAQDERSLDECPCSARHESARRRLNP